MARYMKRIRSQSITAKNKKGLVDQITTPSTWIARHRMEMCRDPSDNMVLEAALELSHDPGDKRVIVSDDQDLLTMHPWRGIHIIKPEAALALLEGSQ